MQELEDDSVQLVITSPPYPMIEMWDDLFSAHDAAMRRALENKNGSKSFALMHDHLLKPVWEETYRILQNGGILCLNIGDATRKIDGKFQLFPNHARAINDLTEIGFSQLPGVLWRKPSSSPTKFMGAGMLGLNAYTTLEHEHILTFRKGGNRRTKGKEETRRRRESAYFWEERNDWFTDVWTDLRGVRQTISHGHEDLRKRSAAFPLVLPLRLIHMYSVYGDTVVDPFWGTGTTSQAAAFLGRDSVGYEVNPHFWPLFEKRMEQVSSESRQQNKRRLRKHSQFVNQRHQKGKPLKYESERYSFGVMTRQERQIKLYDVCAIEKKGEYEYCCSYTSHQLDQHN